MTLDLDYDDGQRAIREALDGFCVDRCDESVVRAAVGRFPDALWRELCELGVLEAASPAGEGGALEVTAAMEALGRWVVPGPWPASVLAACALPAPARDAVVAGEQVVAAGTPPLLPFAPVATVFLELDGERIWTLAVDGPIEPVETLGGEPWGRCRATRRDELADAATAYVLYDAAFAAYAAAAGQRLLEATAEHARTRVQFGKAIGEFQSVAHPLADCNMNLASAAALARAAAWQLDAGDAVEAPAIGAAARLSATRASLQTVNVCHQIFGAVGITLEGPAFHLSRRIQQLASQQPGDRVARELLLAHFQLPGRRPAPAAAGGAP